MASYAPISGSDPQSNPLFATAAAAAPPRARSRLARLALAAGGLAVASLALVNLAPSFPSFRFFGGDEADELVVVPDSAMSPSVTGIGLTRVGRPNSRAAHEEALAAADEWRPPYTAYFTEAERPLLAAFDAADRVADEASPLHALAQYPVADPAAEQSFWPDVAPLYAPEPVARFDELANPKCSRRGFLIHARPAGGAVSPSTPQQPKPKPAPKPKVEPCPQEGECLLPITSGDALSKCEKLSHCKVEACGLFKRKCVSTGGKAREVFFADDAMHQPWSSAWAPSAVGDLAHTSLARMAAPTYGSAGLGGGAEVVPSASLADTSFARTSPAHPPVWSGPVCRWDRLELEKFSVGMRAKFTIDLSGPPKMTDVFYLVDGSKSMGEAVRAMKKQRWKLLKLFGDRKNVNYGLGVFRDERGKNLGLNLRTPLTSNRKKMRRLINGIRPGGGRDRDEANLVSLYRVANDTDTIKWRHHSRKYVVLIADWPGHEPSCPKWYRITRTVVGRLLLKKQITMIVVNVGQQDGGSDAIPRPYRCRGDGWAPGPGQGTQLAKQTFGAAITLPNPWKMAEAVKNRIHAIPARITIGQKVCDRGFNTSLSTKLPLVVPPGGVRSMSNTIRVRRTICDKPERTYKCWFTFFDFGGTIGSLRVRAKRIGGCPEYAREELVPDEQ